MDLFDLVAKLTLDSSEYESGLNEAEGKASKMGGAMGTAAKVGGAAIAAASTATVAFAKSAVDAGMNFDASMSQVAATMGTTVDQIGNLRDFAQEMGRSTAFSATEAADALNYMALAGYDADTSMAMLPNVLNLAAAGGFELADASDMITDTQSALGLSLEETSDLVDKMAKAASKSNTSVEQLGSAMLTVGGTAKTMAGGTTEISAALGILADNGTKGAEGGTALRNVLLGLQSGKFEKTFGELGVSAYDAEGNMRELKDILADMNGVMEGMTDQEKTAIISDTFNKADLKNVNALLATTTERWDELSGAIDDSSGAAQAMADTQLDNLAGDMTLFNSALEGAKIQVSDQLTPTLREFVQLGTSGLEKITSGFAEGGLSGAMEGLGEFLAEGVNKIMEALPTILDAGTKLILALVEGIVSNAPALASAAVEIITNFANTIGEALPTLIPMITEAIMGIFQALTDPEAMTGLMEAAMALLQGFFEGILAALPIIVEQLPVIIENIMGFLQASLPIWIEGLMQIVSMIAEQLPTIISSILEMLPQIIDMVVNGLISLLPVLVEGSIQLFMGIVQAIPQALPAIVAALPQIITSIIDGLTTLLPELVTAGVELFVALVENLPEAIVQIVSQLPAIIKAIVDGLMKSAPKLIQCGVDLIKGLGQGIVKGGAAALKAVASVGKAVVDKAKSLLGIHSPSTVFEELGKFLDEGMAIGIEANVDKVSQAMNDMRDATSLSDGDFGDEWSTSTITTTNGATTAPVASQTQVTAILEVDKVQLGKVVFDLNNAETQRIGVNLATGGF